MRHNEIILGSDHAAIYERYFVEECVFVEEGEAVNPTLVSKTRTIAKVTNGITARTMINIDRIYNDCTVEELIAIAAYAKQLATEKIRNMKKYL